MTGLLAQTNAYIRDAERQSRDAQHDRPGGAEPVAPARPREDSR